MSLSQTCRPQVDKYLPLASFYVLIPHWHLDYKLHLNYHHHPDHRRSQEQWPPPFLRRSKPSSSATTQPAYRPATSLLRNISRIWIQITSSCVYFTTSPRCEVLLLERIFTGAHQSHRTQPHRLEARFPQLGQRREYLGVWCCRRYRPCRV